MRDLSTDFFINGKPLLVPDEQVQHSYEDLDSAASGRDESGYMHRFVERYKVGAWAFSYGHLTEQEKQYMEALFPDTPTFTFRHPSRLDAATAEDTVCYRSRYALSWKNARTGLWSGYGFSVIQC
jgi:hypothetical protein